MRTSFLLSIALVLLIIGIPGFAVMLHRILWSSTLGDLGRTALIFAEIIIAGLVFLFFAWISDVSDKNQ